MPINVGGTGGLGNGETWRMSCFALNSCQNIQFEFPGFGRYDTVTGGTGQVNEQAWPTPFSFSAALDVELVASNCTADTGGVLTDTSQSWIPSQFVTKTASVGTLTVASAGTADGVTTIPLASATTVYMRAGGLLFFSPRIVRLTQDVPVGSLSLPVGTVQGNINGSTTCTGIAYGPDPQFMLIDPATNNATMITANTATTITYMQNGFSPSGGGAYQIWAVYPLLFNGQPICEYTGWKYIASDPIPALRVLAGTPLAVRTEPIGTAWPGGDYQHNNQDWQTTRDCVFGGRGTNGTVSNVPYRPCASYGDPLPSVTPLPTIVALEDSKTYGNYDCVYQATMGWLLRACDNLGAGPIRGLINLSCPGELAVNGAAQTGKAAYRRRLLAMADEAFVGMGTNDVGLPLSLAQCQYGALANAQAAADAGVPIITGMTIGPFTTGPLSGYVKGNEASQVVSQATVLGQFDNWMATVPAPFTRCFDWRTVLQLPGSPGKWNTYNSILTGTCLGAQSATGLVDTSGNLDAAIGSSWPFSQATAAQLQFQGCIVALVHSATTYYNYVDYTNPTVTAGTLYLKNNWGFTPTAGDAYTIYPAATFEGTHLTPYSSYLMAKAIIALGL